MKTAVITGATSGIGLATAITLCRQGYAVFGIGRSKDKCDAAQREISANAPGGYVEFFCADLAHQTDVNKVADEITECLEKYFDGRLFALINNAGGVRNWYTTTFEGYETQFALNHLAGFLLTYRLMPLLIKAGGKMIITGSASHKFMRIRWDDIMFKKHYSCLYAYKQSKLCNLLFAKEFNKRFRDKGVRSFVVDPGLVKTDIGSKDTSGFVSWFWNNRKKHGKEPYICAQTYAFILNEPGLNGLFYRGLEQRKYHKNVDKEDAERLWRLSEKLCGIDYNEVIL